MINKYLSNILVEKTPIRSKNFSGELSKALGLVTPIDVSEEQFLDLVGIIYKGSISMQEHRAQGFFDLVEQRSVIQIAEFDKNLSRKNQYSRKSDEDFFI